MRKNFILSIFVIAGLSVAPALAAGHGGAAGAGGAGKDGGTRGADGMPGCDGGAKPAADGKYYLSGTKQQCNPGHQHSTKPHKKAHSK